MRFIYTKTFGIFAVCLLAVAILAFFQQRGWLDQIRKVLLVLPKPVERAVATVTLPVKGFFTTIYQLRKITVENTQLKSRVSELEQSVAELNQQARENEALRKELGFVKNTKQALVSCTVLSENPFGLSDAVVLNCGSEAGVGEGQAVISQGYLVGKIVYSGSKASTALLITDSNFSTDARISQTDQSGIVQGSFGSGLVLDQVPQAADLEKDWLVVTAGINSKVPKNILIGRVNDIISRPGDLFKKAALVSPIDFNNLNFVFVVKQ